MKSCSGRYVKQRTLTTTSPIIHPYVGGRVGREREGREEGGLPPRTLCAGINPKGRVHSGSMLCVSLADRRNLWWHFIKIFKPRSLLGFKMHDLRNTTRLRTDAVVSYPHRPVGVLTGTLMLCFFVCIKFLNKQKKLSTKTFTSLESSCI